MRWTLARTDQERRVGRYWCVIVRRCHLSYSIVFDSESSGVVGVSMRATARNNLTYVKRDPWYAYELLDSLFGILYDSQVTRAAIQPNFRGLER